MTYFYLFYRNTNGIIDDERITSTLFFGVKLDMNNLIVPTTLLLAIVMLSCVGQSGSEGEKAASCLCSVIAPLFPIRAVVKDIGTEYVVLTAEFYLVTRPTPLEAGAILTGPPDASVPDTPILTQGFLDDSVPAIGQTFGGSWDGSPICGFGCVQINIGDEVLAYFERGKQDSVNCPEYKACSEQNCSWDEDAAVPWDVCDGDCVVQTREVCLKHEEETWLQGSLRLTRWDDALVVGEYKGKVVRVTPAELNELHNVFSGHYNSCDEQFPNVAYALYHTGRKPSRTAQLAPAETEESLKCQFASE